MRARRSASASKAAARYRIDRCFVCKVCIRGLGDLLLMNVCICIGPRRHRYIFKPTLCPAHAIRRGPSLQPGQTQVSGLRRHDHSCQGSIMPPAEPAQVDHQRRATLDDKQGQHQQRSHKLLRVSRLGDRPFTPGTILQKWAIDPL